MSEYILKFNQQKKNLYNTVIAKLLQEKKKVIWKWWKFGEAKQKMFYYYYCYYYIQCESPVLQVACVVLKQMYKPDITNPLKSKRNY